jgi:hypothetical protein
MNYLRRFVIILGTAFVLCGASEAATITTSDFRDFENPFLLTYNIGQVPPGNLTTLGPVKITNSPANMFFWGGAYITGTPSNPAQPGGWGATSERLPLILTINPPVKAFGVTFDFYGTTVGPTLAVYDGPNGTGQLLGQIQSVRVTPPWTATNQPIDFVGVIDDQIRIRSAVLIGYGTDELGIRAMALSIPEPSTTFLLLAGILPLRRWRP